MLTFHRCAVRSTRCSLLPLVSLAIGITEAVYETRHLSWSQWQGRECLFPYGDYWKAVTDNCVGPIHPISSRTIPKSGPRHTFFVSTDIIYNTYNGPHIHKIANYLTSCDAPQWNSGLDGHTKEWSTSVDRPDPICFANGQPRNEPCTLGQLEDNRTRTCRFSRVRPSLPSHVEGWRRICCISWKRRCVYNYSKSSSAIPI